MTEEALLTSLPGASCCPIDCPPRPGNPGHASFACRSSLALDPSFGDGRNCPLRRPSDPPFNGSCTRLGCPFDHPELKCCCDGLGHSQCILACPNYQCPARRYHPILGCHYHLEVDARLCPKCRRLRCPQCVDEEESSCRKCSCIDGQRGSCSPGCGAHEKFCSDGFFEKPDICVSCGCREGRFSCYATCRSTYAFIIETSVS